MWHDILNVFSYQLLWFQGINSQLGDLLHNKINLLMKWVYTCTTVQTRIAVVYNKTMLIML